MTAPAVPSGPHRVPGRTPRILIAALAVTLLLAPLAYLWGQLWTATENGAGAAATERAAIAYARPVTKLLAALVEAQYAATRKTASDPDAVRAAVGDVNGVDRDLVDLLQIGERWTLLVLEIDRTLNQNTTGAAALPAYAAPIALTQALLDRIAYACEATRDLSPASYQLLNVALRRLPDVMASAGQVAALSFAAAPPGTDDPRLIVADDRMARAAADAGVALRTGTEPAAGVTVDLRLLEPLDGFAAAADDLHQAVAGPTIAGGDTRDRIGAASSRIQAAALALDTAVLDAADTRIRADADEYAQQRRIQVLAAVVFVLATVALLWLGVSRPAAAGMSADPADGRQRSGDDAGPGSPARAIFTHARELPASEVVHAERLAERQGSNDHR